MKIDRNLQGNGTPLRAWHASRRLDSVAPISAAELVGEHQRAVIVAPHPDDEVLGCGGLLQRLVGLKRRLMLISVTDGSAAYPGSLRWSAERLSIIRPQESTEALRRLGVPLNETQWIHGGFPDSAVAAHEARLVQFLGTYLQPSDVLFTPWRGDGHTDHEAVARACVAAARAVGASVHEVPIWAWHWAQPEDQRLPWERARKLELDLWTQARKRHAIQAFASQTQGDPERGIEPILSPIVLERLQQSFEVIFL
ncbi:PIG-L family deacetylase [Pseudomonas sp. UL073]|uniref:PIG-L family deacetylase n=1 Tax=Zestomonas insulae TaxID=2809017 RepID=A0ABS2IFN4_9GAMM|nr:PIG-L family deacetylase [Pseudomonas insulae]MBM7061894.1 PIG-L family deacetylase [Pseudomonas insulae]